MRRRRRIALTAVYIQKQPHLLFQLPHNPLNALVDVLLAINDVVLQSMLTLISQFNSVTSLCSSCQEWVAPT